MEMVGNFEAESYKLNCSQSNGNFMCQLPKQPETLFLHSVQLRYWYNYRNKKRLLLSPTPRRTGSNLFLSALTLFAALFPEVPFCWCFVKLGATYHFLGYDYLVDGGKLCRRAWVLKSQGVCRCGWARCRDWRIG
jgi:hypothetical protein